MRERDMKWLQIKRYNWKNYDIFLIAVVLILTGIVTFDVGMEHIDFGTLGVLVGMMIFVAVVKQSGIFEYIAIKTAKAAKGNPWIIMVLFSFITAILSAI